MSKRKSSSSKGVSIDLAIVGAALLTVSGIMVSDAQAQLNPSSRRAVEKINSSTIDRQAAVKGARQGVTLENSRNRVRPNRSGVISDREACNATTDTGMTGCPG